MPQQVIVFLNSQNETNSTAANRLAAQYEDEIQSILSHARTRVRTLAQRVDGVDIEQVYKDAQGSAQRELTAEIDRLRETSAAAEVERNRAFKEQVKRARGGARWCSCCQGAKSSARSFVTPRPW